MMRTMVDMTVSGLTVDPFTNMPIIVLKDKEGRHALPIWVGLIEASAIATELERIQLRRPMTHDLMHNLLGSVGARVQHVEVNDLRDNTFYACIVVCRDDGGVIEVDSRPSDAIALALRAAAPIRVARKVIDRALRVDLRDGAIDAKTQRNGHAPKNGSTNGSNGDRRDARHGGAEDTSVSGDGRIAALGRDTRPAAFALFASDEIATDVLENLSEDVFGKWKM